MGEEEKHKIQTTRFELQPSNEELSNRLYRATLIRKSAKKCEVCGILFKSITRRIYCSKECEKKAKKVYHKHKIAEERLMDKLALMPSEIVSKFQELASKQQFVEDIPIMNNNKCYICGSQENLIQHHISYNPEEKIILCKKCHTILHVLILQKRKCRPLPENRNC